MKMAFLLDVLISIKTYVSGDCISHFIFAIENSRHQMVNKYYLNHLGNVNLYFHLVTFEK